MLLRFSEDQTLMYFLCGTDFSIMECSEGRKKVCVENVGAQRTEFYILDIFVSIRLFLIRHSLWNSLCRN